MARIKSIAISMLMSIFIALWTLTITYAIIPTFLPEIAGTPMAWAWTAICLIPSVIVIGILMLIVSRTFDD